MEERLLDKHTANEEAETRGFIHGLAFAIGWVIAKHDEESMALELLRHSGFDYADLLNAKCDRLDLKPIAKALKLRVDGTPRKSGNGYQSNDN